MGTSASIRAPSTRSARRASGPRRTGAAGATPPTRARQGRHGPYQGTCATWGGPSYGTCVLPASPARPTYSKNATTLADLRPVFGAAAWVGVGVLPLVFTAACVHMCLRGPHAPVCGCCTGCIEVFGQPLLQRSRACGFWHLVVESILLFVAIMSLNVIGVVPQIMMVVGTSVVVCGCCKQPAGMAISLACYASCSIVAIVYQVVELIISFGGGLARPGGDMNIVADLFGGLNPMDL